MSFATSIDPRPSGAVGLADAAEQFTERAREVLDRSEAEARRLGHPFVGTEHLLLALVADEDGPVGRAVEQLGADCGALRTTVEFVFGVDRTPTNGEVVFSPIVARVVKRAVIEARRLNHPVADSGHLLIGLVREGGRGAGVLKLIGIPPERLRQRVIAELGVGAAPPARPEPAEEPARSWL